ncbi:MAG: hypothetical protein U9N85_07205 [Bacteroidota bacterium]|nr:hypothetical protein [Bacteroidota bacterium]
MATTIPEKSRAEWKKIITGEIEHNYRNYVLQTKIHQMRKDVSKNKISIDNAIDDLYELCFKYALAVQIDFRQIFKTW